MAKRSVALECNGEKRKPRAAGIGRQIIHALHLRRVIGAFVVLIPATMMIEMIIDVSSMKRCVEELGAENVIFIADKGFYSNKNVTDLRNNNLHYIKPLYRNNSLIDFKPLQQANFKKAINTYFTYQNRIIWYYRYEQQGQIITYIDEKLRVEEQNDYLARTKTHPDEYCEDAFFKKMHQFGTLTLVRL